RYVSTVDSGNLVGFLLTLRQGLLSQATEPIIKKSFYEGLITIVKIIQENSRKHDEKTERIIAVLNAALNENSNSLSSVKGYIDKLGPLINDLSLTPSDAESKKWISKLSVQLNSFHDDLLQIVPWINLLPVPENFEKLYALDNIPSLRTILNHSQLLETINFY